MHVILHRCRLTCMRSRSTLRFNSVPVCCAVSYGSSNIYEQNRGEVIACGVGRSGGLIIAYHMQCMRTLYRQ